MVPWPVATTRSLYGDTKGKLFSWQKKKAHLQLDRRDQGVVMKKVHIAPSLRLIGTNYIIGYILLLQGLIRWLPYPHMWCRLSNEVKFPLSSTSLPSASSCWISSRHHHRHKHQQYFFITVVTWRLWISLWHWFY